MPVRFIELAGATFVLSCVSLTIILSLEKWRAFEFYQIHRPRSWPASVCVYCLGFWISLLIFVAVFFLFRIDAIYFISPFASAGLTRVLYESSGITRR